MRAGESNPTPLAIMEKTRHPSAPAVLMSAASPSAVKRPDAAAKKTALPAQELLATAGAGNGKAFPELLATRNAK